MKPHLILAFGLLVSVPVVVRAQHPEGGRGEGQRGGEAHAPRANQGTSRRLRFAATIPKRGPK